MDDSRADAADRARIQRQIDRLEPLIRRRIRWKFRALRRSIVDLDDVLSSARQRVDAAAMSGAIRGQEREIAAYVQRTAERVTVDMLRHEQRERMLRGALLQASASKPEHVELDDLEVIEDFMQHFDEAEQAVLALWARGVPQQGIAAALGVGFEACRTRWRRILAKLRARAVEQKQTPDASSGRPPPGE